MISSKLSVITGPGAEPVSLAEAKQWARIDGVDQDPVVTELIVAARRFAEAFTGRQLVSATLEAAWDWSFPSCLTLPRPPLQTVAFVKYLDAAGAEQTLAANQYVVDARATPGRIVPAYGVTWPATRCLPNAVWVRFVAGYGAAAAVPEDLKTALKVHVADGYEHRLGPEAAAERAVTNLLYPYRVWAL